MILEIFLSYFFIISRKSLTVALRRQEEEEVPDDEPSPENPEEEVYDEHPDDVVRIEITLNSVKDEVRELLWEEQYITEALARVMWDGGIMDGSIERVSTVVRSQMDLHTCSRPWVFLDPAGLFVEFVLKQISHRNTGDRTLEIITMPVAEFWVLYPPPVLDDKDAQMAAAEAAIKEGVRLAREMNILPEEQIRRMEARWRGMDVDIMMRPGAVDIHGHIAAAVAAQEMIAKNAGAF